MHLLMERPAQVSGWARSVWSLSVFRCWNWPLQDPHCREGCRSRGGHHPRYFGFECRSTHRGASGARTFWSASILSSSLNAELMNSIGAVDPASPV